MVALIKQEAARPRHNGISPCNGRPRKVRPARSLRQCSGYEGDGALTLYLREIGQVKGLTPREQIELAGRAKEGNKGAREQLIKAHLPLVVKIAREYEDLGLPLLDLVAEGNVGLMKAVAHFDPARGGTLSSYSPWWIKQAIKRALVNHCRTSRRTD
jgi:RNA polymerase primary sigma factor